MSKIIVGDNELTINNQVLDKLREDLNNGLKMAVITANGTNIVTVSAKVVIEEVINNEGFKEIIDLKHQVKVSAKNSIWDADYKTRPFNTAQDEDGNILAFPEEDPQLSMDDLEDDED